MKSAYFLIPALFCIPAAISLFLAINIKGYKSLTYALLFIFEVCIWTNTAPINALSINVIQPELRGIVCFTAYIFTSITYVYISTSIIYE